MYIYQRRFRREWRPSLSVISATVIAFGRSCLLANTSTVASTSSCLKWEEKEQWSLKAKEKKCEGSWNKEVYRIKHLTKHPMKLIPSFWYPLFVITVHHKDKTLRVLEIMPPQRSNLYAIIKKAMESRRLLEYISNYASLYHPPNSSISNYFVTNFFFIIFFCKCFDRFLFHVIKGAAIKWVKLAAQCTQVCSQIKTSLLGRFVQICPDCTSIFLKWSN